MLQKMNCILGIIDQRKESQKVFVFNLGFVLDYKGKEEKGDIQDEELI